jgi:hypothetical protein
MLVHSLMAGAAAFLIIAVFTENGANWVPYLGYMLIGTMAFNLLIILFEMVTPHPTIDSKRVVKMILKGRYRTTFWLGAIIIGNILPIVLLLFGPSMQVLAVAVGVLVILGIYFTEKIWVEAPQRIPLV